MYKKCAKNHVNFRFITVLSALITELSNKINLRSRHDLSKLLRRSEKKIKDANLQVEEERRTAEQYKEQVSPFLMLEKS